MLPQRVTMTCLDCQCGWSINPDDYPSQDMIEPFKCCCGKMLAVTLDFPDGSKAVMGPGSKVLLLAVKTAIEETIDEIVKRERSRLN